LTNIKLTVVQGEELRTLLLPEGSSLLESLRNMDVHVASICGGNGSCGKCRVRVLDGALDITDNDERSVSKDDLGEGWRLACAATLWSDLTIEAEPAREENFSVVVDFSGSFSGAGTLDTTKVAMEKSPISVTDRMRRDGDAPLSMETLRGCSQIVESGASEAFVTRAGGRILRVGRTAGQYAIAVDIGTTTLCFALVSLVDGTVKGRLSAVNRQREYGADVISRIHRAANGELAAIGDVIRRQVAEAARKICDDNGVAPDSVIRMAFAGNTAMLHILLGLSCRTLGVYPFTPVTLDLLHLKYKDIFEGHFTCAVDFLPGLSTYVGADIASGILFSGLLESESPALLLDMGTNGEMAASREGWLYCTATAAGPAFEGGNIEWGTGSVPGAISSVKFEDGEPRIETINGATPVGICGSGVIDATAECLAAGFLSTSGRFEADYRDGVALGLTSAGEKIRFTQKDVREVQLGKSAVRSGIDTLLRTAGLSYGDIGSFYIAGGFGYRLDFESGIAIGLFPKELAGRMKPLGNSSLGGVITYLLDGSAEKRLDAIVQNSSQFELSEDKSFNNLFMENMTFE
jgi:uncharacterized 2Fe-2S/4Fe-4S cluster protein (DUF4445 family)